MEKAEGEERVLIRLARETSRGDSTPSETDGRVRLYCSVKCLIFSFVKLTSMDEALARYNEQNVKDNLKAEMEVIFANVNHRVTKIIRTSFLATNIRHQFVKRLDGINIQPSAFSCC